MLRFKLDSISHDDDINSYLIRTVDVNFETGLVSIYSFATTSSQYAKTQSFIQALVSNENACYQVEFEHPTIEHKYKYHPGEAFFPGSYDNHIHLDFNAKPSQYGFEQQLASFLDYISTSGKPWLHPDMHAALLMKNPSYQIARPTFVYQSLPDSSAFDIKNAFEDESMWSGMNFSSTESSPSSSVESSPVKKSPRSPLSSVSPNKTLMFSNIHNIGVGLQQAANGIAAAEEGELDSVRSKARKALFS